LPFQSRARRFRLNPHLPFLEVRGPDGQEFTVQLCQEGELMTSTIEVTNESVWTAASEVQQDHRIATALVVEKGVDDGDQR
jgi:hypothetical protein